MGVGIRKHNRHCCLSFNPVTIHIDRFEDALRQVLFFWRRQLRRQEIQENREFFPFRTAVGKDRSEEAVGAGERLGKEKLGKLRARSPRSTIRSRRASVPRIFERRKLCSMSSMIPNQICRSPHGVDRRSRALEAEHAQGARSEVCSGSWPRENHSSSRSHARLIQTECRSRMKDSPRQQIRFFCCTWTSAFGVFTQPGSVWSIPASPSCARIG